MPELPERMIVDAERLNFRTRPQVRPETRITRLAEGRAVAPIERSDLGGERDWIVAEVDVESRPTTGYLAAEYLRRPAPSDGGEVDETIPPVRMHSGLASPDRAGSRAHSLPLDEAPTRDPRAPDDEQAESLVEIVAWLDVEDSDRYEPQSEATYCNVYAHDYCHLARAYLPRVWWTDDAIARWLDGESVDKEYGETVGEYSANMLYDWLAKWGGQFGWKRLEAPGELQERVNDGAVGVVVGQRHNRMHSGHVTVVVPEREASAETGADGRTIPLQSQAGATNHTYRVARWWDASRFATHGFWVCS